MINIEFPDIYFAQIYTEHLLGSRHCTKAEMRKTTKYLAIIEHAVWEAGGVKTEMAQLYGLIIILAWHGYIDYTEMD